MHLAINFAARKLRGWRLRMVILCCVATLSITMFYVHIIPRWSGDNSSSGQEFWNYPDDMLWPQSSGKHQGLHVYVVEEHHEVIPVWVNYLKMNHGKKAVLIHIDAHGDMDFPEIVDGFPLGRFPQSDIEVSTMMQANDVFIQSAIVGQLLKDVYSIFPPWVPSDCSVDHFYLGLNGPSRDAQLCLCPTRSSVSCKMFRRSEYLKESLISSKECRKEWVFSHYECGSDDAAPVLRSTLTNLIRLPSVSSSTSPTSLAYYNRNPIIVDIDEDFFGVYLVARNLTDTGLNIIAILQLDRTIQSIFCPKRAVDESFIDTWFQELLAYVRATCARALSGMEVFECQRNISERVYDSLVQMNPAWLCQEDNGPSLQDLVETLTHPTITNEQLLALSRVGLCLTNAWSSYAYEPRMRLCIGHNSPGMTLVKEHVPDTEELMLLASNLTKVLLAIPQKPALITLCRSARDGYTPRWLQPTIEYTITGILKRLFNLTQGDISYSPRLAGGVNGWQDRNS
ncbi:unnamed protein product [Dicrocoelium dendriticum]|nr:unnamed protein product [Dicrocoelium dendriticum]